ncbi:MAG: alpha/beta fold hydrolase [Steroidobacteraceae bacterium]|jgi:pimeloyl-ACP methyl ester carboxylesterase
MAARLWGALLAADIVFAALVAAALSHQHAMPPILSLTIGLAVLPGLPALIVLVASLLRAAVAGADAAERRPGPLLRALITEWFDFDRAILAIIAVPWLDRRARGAPSAGRRARSGARRCARPVLLIHGILCNRGIWRTWFRPLDTAGFGPVRTIDLEPLLGDLDFHARTVAQALEDLQRECEGARVSIVAHSMGGLVARAALRRAGPDVIRDIVTIASPHHGTALARWSPSRPARQMRPGSPWLRALAALETHEVPITSLYSAQDNLVVPARSAVLEGARALEFAGVGHMGLLFRRACIDAAIIALGAAANG